MLLRIILLIPLFLGCRSIGDGKYKRLLRSIAGKLKTVKQLEVLHCQDLNDGFIRNVQVAKIFHRIFLSKMIIERMS